MLIRVLTSFVVPLAFWLAGCQSAMVPMPNVYGMPINANLSLERSREAIKLGALSAGWTVDDVSDDTIIATYKIRAHTVIVNIGYSPRSYGIFYKNSYNMKIQCGTRPATKKSTISVGQTGCPDGTVPTYIHENYKLWVDQLNDSIQAALQAACYADRACR